MCEMHCTSQFSVTGGSYFLNKTKTKQTKQTQNEKSFVALQDMV